MEHDTVGIIGAGIAGLTAGCYAQIHGYHTQVFEMHDKPGGYCTAWKRKGYAFGGCIHHLAGIGPAWTVYPLWHDLGIFERHTVHFYDKLVQVEMADGQTFVAHTDIDQLAAYLKQLAMEYAPVIDVPEERFSGLADVHMAGQWAEAMIGISTAAISGRNAVRRMCRQDRWRFKTSVREADADSCQPKGGTRWTES